MVDALGDRLAVLELALGEIASQALERLAVAVLPVVDNHPLHLDSIDQHRAQHYAAIRLGRAVLGDEAAHDDSREQVHQAQDGVEYHTADVLEVDIHALGAMLPQVCQQIARLVIDAGIEAQLLHDVVTFCLASGDADAAATLDLGELPDDAAYCAGSG